MEIALSILSACLVSCVVYIIQTQRNDFNTRQKATHDRLGELHSVLVQVLARVAVLEDRYERRRE